MKNRLLVSAAITLLVFVAVFLTLVRPGRRDEIAVLPEPAPAPAPTPTPVREKKTLTGESPVEPTAVVTDLPQAPSRSDLSTTISGRVLAQETATPLARALVRIRVESGPLDAEVLAWSGSTETDGQGQFVFDGLEYAPHHLRVSSTGRLAIESTAVFPGDIVELRLERHDDIACQLVLDGDDGTLPLPHARVKFLLLAAELDWAFEAESDGSGLVSIAGIRRDDFESARKKNQIEVVVPGYAEATLAAVPGGDSYRVAVESGIVVTGLVQDAVTGGPIAGASICSDSGHEVLTNERGEFRITGVSDDLTAYAAGYIPETIELEGDEEEGETTRQQFRLKRGLVLKGRLKDAVGAPLAGFRISVAADAWTLDAMYDALPGRLKEAYACVTDAEGAYRLEGLSAEILALPGDLELEVLPPKAATGYPHEVEVVEVLGEVERDIVLDLQALLAGSVRDGDGGPVPRAGIFLESIDSDALSVGGTDAAGEFVLKNVIRGSYRLRVERDGQLLHLQDVDLPLSRLDVTLSARSRLQGVVHAEDSREAIAGMAVSLFALGVNRARITSEVLTDSDGKFEIDGVPPGDYALILNPGSQESLFSRLGLRHEAPVTVGPDGWQGSIAYPVLASGEIRLTFQLATRSNETSPVAGSVWVSVLSYRPIAGVPVSATTSEAALVPEPEQGFQARWRCGDYRLRLTTTLEGRTLVKEESITLSPDAVVGRTVSFLR